jgi:hypothetical protein
LPAHNGPSEALDNFIREGAFGGRRQDLGQVISGHELRIS